MKALKLILPGLILLALACSAPTDLETPRKKVKTSLDTMKIKPVMRDITFEENGSEKHYITTGSYLAVDTSVNPPAAWLYLRFEAEGNNYDARSRIQIANMEIKADSIPMNGMPYQFLNYLSPSSFSKFKLWRGLNCTSDTTMYSGQDKNICEISITIDKASKKVWSQFYSRVFNYQVWIEKRDTVIKDTTWVIKYDTIWVDNKPVVKERKERIIKELKLTIEQEKRNRDSLFIRGKFNFDY